MVLFYQSLSVETLNPPEAKKEVLIKRLSDLIGLPPSPEEVDTYMNDTSSDAMRKWSSFAGQPALRRRMAMEWLDAARYADSNGFQFDGETYQWIWRDWVVKALNEDMPFDQFTIWQLAGDLLPHSTIDQKIASGFNRNHLNNGEGGAIPEEQRFVILFDRMDVTSTTWLGLTMACAQCHDHKYDPITARDYYGMMDAFNHVSESGRPGKQSKRVRVAAPFIELPTEENKLKIKEFEDRIAKLRHQSNGNFEVDEKAQPLPSRSGPVRARFVRLTNNTPKGVLHLAEVEIYHADKNLALSSASQSSQFGMLLRIGQSMETPMALLVKSLSVIPIMKPSPGWRSIWVRKRNRRLEYTTAVMLESRLKIFGWLPMMKSGNPFGQKEGNPLRCRFGK